MAMTVKAMVEESRKGIENLSAAEVAAELETGAPLLVDVREPSEAQSQGMIPGAISAPRGMLEFYADPTSPYHRDEFDPERRTILYCASGGRSALATAALQRLGYADVAHLDEGFKGWVEAGKQIEQVPQG